MALRCIQCVFHRRAVDGNAMNHTLFQQLTCVDNGLRVLTQKRRNKEI